MRTEPSPAMAAILDRLAIEDAGVPDATTVTPVEGRAIAERTHGRWNVDLQDVAVADHVEIAGRRALRIIPHEDAGRGAILYLHGGGFCLNSPATHERMIRALAIAAQAPVISPAYRLAPEHPFPAAVEDTQNALRAMHVEWAGRAIGISGDSAGGNLAVTALLGPDAPKAAAALLFYGVLGTDFETPSYRLFEDGPGLTRGKMMRFMDWYAPMAVRKDPRVAPVLASDEALAALPPAYLVGAGVDVLRSDTEAFHARLTALGRDDPLDMVEGVIHGFLQMTLALPEARDALDRAGAAFRRMIA